VVIFISLGIEILVPLGYESGWAPELVRIKWQK
jgi:hypothetical protein